MRATMPVTTTMCTDAQGEFSSQLILVIVVDTVQISIWYLCPFCGMHVDRELRNLMVHILNQ